MMPSPADCGIGRPVPIMLSRVTKALRVPLRPSPSVPLGAPGQHKVANLGRGVPRRVRLRPQGPASHQTRPEQLAWLAHGAGAVSVRFIPAGRNTQAAATDSNCTSVQTTMLWLLRRVFDHHHMFALTTIVAKLGHDWRIGIFKQCATLNAGSHQALATTLARRSAGQSCSGRCR